MNFYLNAPATMCPLDEKLGVQYSQYLSDYTFVDWEYLQKNFQTKSSLVAIGAKRAEPYFRR
jgi:hypothetical protein